MLRQVKKTMLAAAVAGTLLGVAAPASAYVYGLSSLEIENLSIDTTPTASVNTFTFTLTNTARFQSPGTTVSTGADCNQSGGCGGPGAPLALDAQPANGLDNTFDRTNNDFTFHGPGSGDSYAGSDSVIYDAELVGDANTDTEQIAESELTVNGGAVANSEIQSTTNLIWNFTIGTGSLDLDFTADVDQFASIVETSGLNSAQTNVNASFTLTHDTLDLEVSWAPQGTAANDCSVTGADAGAVTCQEVNDGADLNRNVGVTTNGATNQNSYELADTFALFGIDVRNLPAGNYTLVLNAVTSNNLQRNVPEPVSLALFGVGLLGVGMFARRRKLGF